MFVCLLQRLERGHGSSPVRDRFLDLGSRCCCCSAACCRPYILRHRIIPVTRDAGSSPAHPTAVKSDCVTLNHVSPVWSWKPPRVQTGQPLSMLSCSHSKKA